MTEDPQATRVLVVDDEHSICRALEISFRRAGYYVRAVESAEDAVQLLQVDDRHGVATVDDRHGAAVHPRPGDHG